MQWMRSVSMLTRDLDVSFCVVCGHSQDQIFSYQNHHYHKCSSCGLVTTLPFPSAAQIHQHYSEKFKTGNYKLAAEQSQAVDAVARGMAHMLQKYLWQHDKAVKGAKLLDVGCFTGNFLYHLQELGADVGGVELQHEAMQIANKRLGSDRVVQVDVMTQDLAFKQYDVISILGVVEHVTNPMSLMRRSMELLAPGGVLMIQTPDSGSLMAKTLGKFWPPYSPVEHIHLLSANSLRVALTGLGFENVVVKKHIKHLPVDYVMNILQFFGPEFRKILWPFYRMLRPLIGRWVIPAYVGEIVVFAQKKKTTFKSSFVV